MTDKDSFINAVDSQRIRRAMFRMPFATPPAVPIPGSHLGNPHRVTTDEVVTFLEQLGNVLREHGERHAALETQHGQLIRDVQAFRRIIGTDPL